MLSQIVLGVTSAVQGKAWEGRAPFSSTEIYRKKAYTEAGWLLQGRSFWGEVCFNGLAGNSLEKTAPSALVRKSEGRDYVPLAVCPAEASMLRHKTKHRHVLHQMCFIPRVANAKEKKASKSITLC